MLKYNEPIIFKIQKYYLGNILDENNEELIAEIENNLKKEGLKLLIKAIWNLNDLDSVLNFIKYLKKNYDGKHTISVTDAECRWMPDKKGVMGLNYNFQVVIDDKNDFIIEKNIVNDPSDHHQLIHMIERVKMKLSQHPNFYTADNGYYTLPTLEYLFQNNIKAIIPDRNQSSQMKRKNKDQKYNKVNFKYNWTNDTFTCPQGKTLEHQKDRRIKKELHKVYSTNECKTCKSLKECTKSPKREIIQSAHPLKEKMRQDFHSDYGRQIYKKRLHTGEIFFARLQTRNFPGIRRKTIKNAQSELTLHSIAHNIKIIHKHIKQQ